MISQKPEREYVKGIVHNLSFQRLTNQEIFQGIIDAHGGTMWIDKNYNNGACFRFTLPRNDENLKVLVIDDNKESDRDYIIRLGGPRY